MRAPELSDDEGAALVAAARHAAASHLGAPLGAEPPRVPDAHHGVFVTITGSSGLRGCIGFLEASALRETIKEAAIAAATQDSRFEPITVGELASLTFEVSVLSEPEAIPGERAAYPEAIKVGRDGLIIRRGLNSGLLLPQVPLEFSWSATEFLDHTCQKAGLGAKCWQDEETVVTRFCAAIFREESPGARAVRI